MLAFSHKKIKEILKYTVFMLFVYWYIWRLNVKLLQYEPKFKNVNVGWD